MNVRTGQMLYIALMTVAVVFIGIQARLLFVGDSHVSTGNASVFGIVGSVSLIAALLLKMRLDRQKQQ